MKTHLYIIIATTAAMAASCGHGRHEQAESLPEIEVAEPIVDSVTIHSTYPGHLMANREVDLVARVDGYLVGKEYSSGQFVKEGTVLFRIEDKNYRDAVVQAEAALSQAEANLAYSTKRYEALKEALKGDAVSEMEVAQAKSTVAENRAAVETAKAELQTARTQLSYCTVRAPFDGHVGDNVISVGSYVAGAGAPVKLSRIYEDADMIAVFSVDDSNTMGQLTENIKTNGVNNKAIPVSFSDRPVHEYTADLTYLAPQVNTTTGTVEIHAVIANPYNELRSGMYVSVDLPVAADPHAILVRDASIGTDQLGKYIYLVNDSDRVVYTPVSLGGQVRDSLRIVTKGVSPDDRYVTKALLKVRDGMPVHPVLAK